MDLKEILAIAGKPGLYKIIAQTKNGTVVESLIDGKRSTVFAHQRVSSLEEISIFTKDEDLPLKELFKLIFEKQEGKKAIDHTEGEKELRAFIKEIVSNYDEERVYKSDLKKIIRWYNILAEKEMLDFSEDKEGEEKKDDSETKEDDSKTKTE